MYPVEVQDIGSMVDVGGASGAFVTALAERFSCLRGIVLDLSPVQAMVEAFLRRHRVEDRLRFHAADFWENPIPPEADAYALGFVLPDWETEDSSPLLQEIAEAASPGALLIIDEYLLHDNKTSPRFVARSDLNMPVAARGRERTAPEYGAWVHTCGFALQRIYRTSTGKHFLIARRV